MHAGFRAAAVLGLLSVTVGDGTASEPEITEEARLLEIDEQQHQMILSGDAGKMRELAHPNLRINAPTNEVLQRAEFLRRLEAREIAFEAHTRFPEAVVITGDVGVIMGREAVTPTQTSESGRLFGVQPLTRRYTNIYLREGGQWKYLARHANVVLAASARPQQAE